MAWRTFWPDSSLPYLYNLLSWLFPFKTPTMLNHQHPTLILASVALCHLPPLPFSTTLFLHCIHLQLSSHQISLALFLHFSMCSSITNHIFTGAFIVPYHRLWVSWKWGSYWIHLCIPRILHNACNMVVSLENLFSLSSTLIIDKSSLNDPLQTAAHIYRKTG